MPSASIAYSPQVTACSRSSTPVGSPVNFAASRGASPVPVYRLIIGEPEVVEKAEDAKAALAADNAEAAECVSTSSRSSAASTDSSSSMASVTEIDVDTGRKPDELPQQQLPQVYLPRDCLLNSRRTWSTFRSVKRDVVARPIATTDVVARPIATAMRTASPKAAVIRRSSPLRAVSPWTPVTQTSRSVSPVLATRCSSPLLTPRSKAAGCLSPQPASMRGIGSIEEVLTTLADFSRTMTSVSMNSASTRSDLTDKARHQYRLISHRLSQSPPRVPIQRMSTDPAISPSRDKCIVEENDGEYDMAAPMHQPMNQPTREDVARAQECHQELIRARVALEALRSEATRFTREDGEDSLTTLNLDDSLRMRSKVEAGIGRANQVCQEIDLWLGNTETLLTSLRDNEFPRVSIDLPSHASRTTWPLRKEKAQASPMIDHLESPCSTSAKTPESPMARQSTLSIPSTPEHHGGDLERERLIAREELMRAMSLFESEQMSHHMLSHRPQEVVLPVAPSWAGSAPSSRAGSPSRAVRRNTRSRTWQCHRSLSPQPGSRPESPTGSFSFETPASPTSSVQAVDSPTSVRSNNTFNSVRSINFAASSARCTNLGELLRPAMKQLPGAQQLRLALQNASDRGLARDHLMMQAEALLQQQDNQEHAARLKLSKALDEAKSLAVARSTMRRMWEAKERLSIALTVARSFGISERELYEAEERRRRIHNLIQDKRGQIRVFCRVRPLSPKEVTQGDAEVLKILDDMSLEIPKMGAFSYDCVFAPGSQEDVFEECRELVQSAVDGHNVTIFTYGQTGAGKTHTLYGNAEEHGIAQRSIAELFQLIDSARSYYSVKVKCSMFEVYNNQLLDLMQPISKTVRQVSKGGIMQPPDGSKSPKLSLRHDRAGNTQVNHLSEHEVDDAEQVRIFLERGMAQRAVAANAMHIESSRSHLIFTISVTSTNRETREVLEGKILLCDLAGSERVKKTDATGEQKKEAIEINKSLTALGDVIEAVAKKQQVVPYRNHKLTQIMQDSLGGTAKTLMFVNVSPASSSLDETVMSLKYAARVKKITNKECPSHSPTRTHSELAAMSQTSPVMSPVSAQRTRIQKPRAPSTPSSPTCIGRKMRTSPALDDKGIRVAQMIRMWEEKSSTMPSPANQWLQADDANMGA